MIHISYLRIILKIILVSFFIENVIKCKSELVKCDIACVALSTCYPAINLLKFNKTEPDVCYFVDAEPFVCCPPLSPELESELDYSKVRISELKCENFYPPPPPFVAVGGYDTEPDEFPFMAVIGYSSGKEISYNCGGFLVERNFVITAAHCANYNGIPASVVRIGGNPLSENATKPIRVIKVFVHPDYKKDTELNDIAILVLGQHVDQTPACLWTDGELDISFHKDLVSMGYGSTSFGGAFANKLLKVYLNLIDNSVCKDHYKNSILETQLCIEGKKRLLNTSEVAIQDTCQGDSGGPLMMQYLLTFRPTVVGIVSYGQSCGSEIPGIYTNISSYLDWIESIIWPGNVGDEKFYVP